MDLIAGPARIDRAADIEKSERHIKSRHLLNIFL